jgi:transposase
MLRMNQIDQIKDLHRQGYGPQEIARRLGIDRKTVRKYLCADDFSATKNHRRNRPSKLDPWKTVIDGWLEEDRKMRYKQRHTAKRIHNRLLSEYAGTYTCSYPLVQRYVKARKREREESSGFLELVWSPGEAQADFGEADIIEAGDPRTIKYLCMSFPSSNAAYLQAFHGETAECVAQGLADIFHHLGGVPRRIVFDNASGIGRRVRDKVSLAELFLRFKCHYGFSVSFCNPASGHEKGNVENKVGYLRRNFFVPIPVVDDLESWNRRLLVDLEADHQRPHYKKGRPIEELFDEERRSLSPLPAKPFVVERFERVRTDGYGKFCVDGRHWYSSSPEQAGSELVIGLGAHLVKVYQTNGERLCEHRRHYGESRTDSSDYRTSIQRLMKRPGAWANSALRIGVSESLRAELDELAQPDLRRVLRILAHSAGAYGFQTALASLEESQRLGALDSYSVQAVAARIACDGLLAAPAAGPDLLVYDRALIGRAEFAP